MGPTALLPLRRKACWAFFRPKNPTALVGCEPANLGTKGQHATSRPPKPLTHTVAVCWTICVNIWGRSAASPAYCTTSAVMIYISYELWPYVGNGNSQLNYRVQAVVSEPIVFEDSWLLGCDTVSSDELFPTFRRWCLRIIENHSPNDTAQHPKRPAALALPLSDGGVSEHRSVVTRGNIAQENVCVRNALCTSQHL